MNDTVSQTRQSRKGLPKTLIGLAVLMFSVLSYVGWSMFFTHTEGMCLGPVCITEEVTLE